MTPTQIAAYRAWLDAEITKAKEEENKAAKIRDAYQDAPGDGYTWMQASADARACMARWVALMDAREGLLKAACGPEVEG